MICLLTWLFTGILILCSNQLSENKGNVINQNNELLNSSNYNSYISSEYDIAINLFVIEAFILSDDQFANKEIANKKR